MVVVAVIGILSGIGIVVGTMELRRASLNAVQLSVAGWLQAVQSNALLKKPDGGCVVTFVAINNLGQGATLATVTPTSCSPEPTLRLNINAFSTSTFSSSTTITSIRFTPRGTTIYPGVSGDNPEMQYRIVRDNTDPVGCVRVSGLAGVVAIGSNPSSSSLTAPCTNFNIF